MPYPRCAVQVPLAGGLPELLRRVRYEVLPTQSAEDRVVGCVPADVPVAVTASPAKGLGPTLDLAVALAGHGYRVVPHLSARQLVDDAHLADVVDRLLAAGIDDVFVPAGDADPPAGRYDAALPVLRRLTELGSPFGHVGITGYPERHPHIDDDITVQAMWDKQSHAGYIVSNLCRAATPRTGCCGSAAALTAAGGSGRGPAPVHLPSGEDAPAFMPGRNRLLSTAMRSIAKARSRSVPRRYGRCAPGENQTQCSATPLSFRAPGRFRPGWR
ncbi:hypothetical protein [Streptomyces sp. 8N616]|uniref:hypothetical protein n=1 Tax=Streptomyces sp. 8N616 TaxID=3457414 RepID=UPI003FD091C8